MALIVLDASVLIAHVDPADALHVAATAALREFVDDEVRLPATAYAEVLVGAVRTGIADQTRERIAKLGYVVVPVDATMAERAADLRAASTSLGLADAIVLAAGDGLEADVVLTGDQRWRRFDRVRVIGLT